MGEHDFGITPTNEYFDDELRQHEDLAARRVAEVQDAAVKENHRSQQALPKLLANGYRAWRSILASSSPAAVAALMVEHDISTKEPRQGASRYSNAIKLFYGARDTKADARIGLDGVERHPWKPDAGLTRYTPVWDMLDGVNPDEDLAKSIAEAGGPDRIMKRAAEQRRKQEQADREGKEPEEKELLIKEGDFAPIDLPIELPEKVGEFMTVLVRRMDGDGFVALAVVKADAEAEFKKLAKSQAKRLRERRDARIEGERRVRIEVDEELGAVVRADPADIKALAARVKAKLAPQHG